MVTRIEFLKGMVALTATSELAKSERSSTAYDHVEWVAQCIKRMETIKPNMTRRQLLTIFKTEGGLSNRQHRTYVSQDCPYFKIDVEFTAIGDTNGEVEAALDVIAKLSRPYLQFTIAD